MGDTVAVALVVVAVVVLVESPDDADSVVVDGSDDAWSMMVVNDACAVVVDGVVAGDGDVIRDVVAGAVQVAHAQRELGFVSQSMQLVSLGACSVL